MAFRNLAVIAVMGAAFALPSFPALTPVAQASVSLAVDAQERGRGGGRDSRGGGQARSDAGRGGQRANRGANQGNQRSAPRAENRQRSAQSSAPRADRQRGAQQRSAPRANPSNRQQAQRGGDSAQRAAFQQRRNDAAQRGAQPRRETATNNPGGQRFTGRPDNRNSFRPDNRPPQASPPRQAQRYNPPNRRAGPPPRHVQRHAQHNRRYSQPSRHVHHVRHAPRRHYAPPRRIVHHHFSIQPSWRYHQRYRSHYANTNFYYADGLCRPSGGAVITGALAGALIGGAITDGTSTGYLSGGLIGAGLGTALSSCDRGQYHYATHSAFSSNAPGYWHNPYSGVRGVVYARDYHTWNSMRCRWGDAEIFLPNGDVTYDRVRMCQDGYGHWQVAPRQ